MKRFIHALHYSGLTLADFRNKTKEQHAYLLMLVVATVSWDTANTSL